MTEECKEDIIRGIKEDRVKENSAVMMRGT